MTDEAKKAAAKRERTEMLVRVFGAGLSWGGLWLLVMLLIGLAIAWRSPGSIDPGEDRMFLFLFGPMGLFSGVVFAVFLLWKDRSRAAATRSFARAITCGVAATALVQVAYLGHGDQGLAANLGMAALFSGIGGVVAAGWLALARAVARFRASNAART